ncbi:MAG: exodeoxyribonuclease III [Christensenellales bacterium]|jgi:exodeoxyribonuclease-3
MKLVSWNVNGFRAIMNKNFMAFFSEADADIFCIQETKMQPGQAEFDAPGYYQYWNSAVKKGYSGTAVFSRIQPAGVRYDLDDGNLAGEGRVITLEFDDFYLVTAYSPNAQQELRRIDYRMAWQDGFCAHLKALDEKKPVIICGDLNVAHQEIDLRHPKNNRGNAGFSDQERGKMTELLESGFTDTFRALYPDVEGAYTWWSYLRQARRTNAGWRIDYFLVSNRLMNRVQDAMIYSDVMGSDHCPVGLVMENRTSR